VFLTGYIRGHARNIVILLPSTSNSIDKGDVIVRPFEPMHPDLAIGGAVTAGLRRLHVWELEDDRSFRRGSFEVQAPCLTECH
jgi:hypothetical protein